MKYSIVGTVISLAMAWSFYAFAPEGIDAGYGILASLTCMAVLMLAVAKDMHFNW